MPTVFIVDGMRFHFYSRGGTPREPVHIHVDRGDARSKFWLRPEVRLARSTGYSARELRKIELLVTEHARQIEEAWHAYFGS